MKRENVSPYRWVILIAAIPIIFSTEMVWLTFSPIASVIAEHYGVSGFAVDMLATSYMIMFIIFCFPAAYVIDRFGFRRSLVIGALLTGIFALTRALFAGSFTAVAISQFIIAIGQPYEFAVTTTAGGQLQEKVEAIGDPGNVLSLTVSGPIDGTDINIFQQPPFSHQFD